MHVHIISSNKMPLINILTKVFFVHRSGNGSLTSKKHVSNVFFFSQLPPPGPPSLPPPHPRHFCYPDHLLICFFSIVVQNRISAMWFKGKELAFAFGCILAFSRLVS